MSECVKALFTAPGKDTCCAFGRCERLLDALEGRARRAALEGEDLGMQTWRRCAGRMTLGFMAMMGLMN